MSQSSQNYFLKVHGLWSTLVLMALALLAFVAVNSALHETYERFWQLTCPGLNLSLRDFVNQGLMTLFLFVITYEAKRFIIRQELHMPGNRLLPIGIIAASLAAPSLLFLLIVIAFGNPAGISGWAIPLASDILATTFILSLFKQSFSKRLHVFLATITLAGILCATTIGALVSNGSIRYTFLAFVVIICSMLWANRARISAQPWLLLLAGCLLWLLLYFTGVNPSVTGLILGIIVLHHQNINTIDQHLHRLVAYVVLPIFMLANAGFVISTNLLTEPGAIGVMIGIITAVVIGRSIGIISIVYILSRLSGIKIPVTASRTRALATSLLSGVSVSPALFIAVMTFGNHTPFLDASKLAIYIASGICLVSSSILFRRAASAI